MLTFANYFLLTSKSIKKRIHKYMIYQHSSSDYVRLKNEPLKPIIKLHIGCGPRILKDWINIDLSYEPNFQNYNYGQKYYPLKIRGNKKDLYLFDIIDVGLPLPENSVDVIFHEDFIEHLDQKEQFQFLAETLRVMKKGGVHRINTPNLLASMEKSSDFLKGIEGVYTAEWTRWEHKNILTPNTLKEMAFMVGYKKILFQKRDISKSKLIPLEFRPGFDRNILDGNIFADLIK